MILAIKHTFFFIRMIMTCFLVIFFVSTSAFAKDSKETVSIHPSESNPAMNSLNDVRAHIDRIDEMILMMLQNRQEMVFHAAQFKTNETEVRDDKRVQAVLDRIGEKAKAIGLDETLARSVYKTMIDRFIAMELERHKTLTQNSAENPE